MAIQWSLEYGTTNCLMYRHNICDVIHYASKSQVTFHASADVESAQNCCHPIKTQPSDH